MGLRTQAAGSGRRLNAQRLEVLDRDPDGALDNGRRRLRPQHVVPVRDRRFAEMNILITQALRGPEPVDAPALSEPGGGGRRRARRGARAAGQGAKSSTSS